MNMKIAFDMQAFQSVNSIGGIGKYNFEFLSTLFTNYQEHNYLLLYNNLKENPLIDELPKPKYYHSRNIPYLRGNDQNIWNGLINYCYYSFLSSDIYHILSPFEDQKNTVIKTKKIPGKLIVTIYDFIPYIFKDLYLPTKNAQDRYMERVNIVSSADLIFSISEATTKDAVDLFNIPSQKIITIGTAPSENFFKMDESNNESLEKIREKFSLPENFILTVSNLDYRKNLLSLLQSYSQLSKSILSKYSLVIVTNSTQNAFSCDMQISKFFTEHDDLEIKLLFSITNDELRGLYNICSLFAYASLYEGGGLPVIEAMKCGAPVIASNTSSIPEFAGRTDNLFDPKDVNDIRKLMEKVLTDENYSNELRMHGLEFSKNITWEKVTERAESGYKKFQND